jgi:histidinol-phosphate/aromatic aminotransferase/cobyric acid decarboxylase-like protein
VVRKLCGEMALSVRGAQKLEPSVSFDLIKLVFGNLYDQETNPDGIISLGVAENYLCHPEITKYMLDHMEIDSVMMTYGDGFSGSIELKKALSRFWNKYLCPVYPLSQDDIIIAAGVTPIIDILAYVLCDAGQGILLGRYSVEGTC